ncbi:MAG: ATP-binding protein, partial [Thermodesulfovibrionales bacterium]|nr:ATP-binding protein [Thermodesulfovibrionales bacterium]
IPQDKLDIIFEAYEQGKGIGERYGGTGLGLYVTRHLVKLHGGDISVRSEEGKGTEFVFSLPKCCTYADTSHSISEMQKTKQDILCKENILPKTIPLIQKKILIVDDELVNRKVLKNFLEHEGYTVITASNGKEALEIIDNNELDLVILDMMLPDIIGYEICRALRETKSLVELPVLIMTADIRPEMVVISFECGANDYLRKPFNRSELMARVKTLISLKNSVNEILTLQKEVAAASNEVAALNENIKENEKVLTEMIEYDKLKTEFFANISHELRTPLNVIWSSIQLLQHIASQGTDAGSISKYLKIMNQNTLRLLRLINNLIDSTKINGGYLSLELSNENIVSVIEEIVLSSVVYAESKGINLIFDTEIEEKYIAVDIEKIERIILNLLSNAVKFTDRNGSIYVNLYDLKDRIRISVKDTGIGIPEKELERIFERFSQVDKSLSRRAEGSGIGLSLVKTFVEMHNGTIRVKSKLHEGSEFIIELPVIQLEGSSGLIEDSSAQFYTSKYMERVHLEFSDI